jgi:L-asparaginase
MKLIIHGGFFSESSQSDLVKRSKQDSLKQILADSFDYLKTHSAEETVVFAVERLENDPLFNAGIGSQIQSDGKIRMSASIMNGDSKKFSGVINVENIKNPIRLASELMIEDDRVLGGDGANFYAKKLNIPFFSTETEERRRDYEEKVKTSRTSTVGCVALDKDGNIAAATSTGGKGFEIPGRISDSATVAGNYANDFCGVSCTGVGEDIVSAAVAVKIVTRVTDGFSLEKAFKKTFDELNEFDGFAGAIAIDKFGNFHVQESHPKVVYGSYDGTRLTVFE